MAAGLGLMLGEGAVTGVMGSNMALEIRCYDVRTVSDSTEFGQSVSTQERVAKARPGGSRRVRLPPPQYMATGAALSSSSP